MCTIFRETGAIVKIESLVHIRDSPDVFEALKPKHYLLGRYNATGTVVQKVHSG